MASFLAAGMQTATWLSVGMDGGGRFFFSTGLHSSHESRGRTCAETEAVAEDDRCCMRARCVITEHLAGRRKSPVRSTEAKYLPGSTAGAGVPEGQFELAALWKWACEGSLRRSEGALPKDGA
jgi:hypothetical protein